MKNPRGMIRYSQGRETLEQGSLPLSPVRTTDKPVNRELVDYFDMAVDWRYVICNMVKKPSRNYLKIYVQKHRGSIFVRFGFSKLLIFVDQ